jgi:hypothetical protein
MSPISEHRKMVREEISSMTTGQRISLQADMGAEIIRRAGPPTGNLSNYAHKITTAGLGVRGIPGDEVYLNDITAMYRAARWAHFGFNVFQLTHSLAAGLLLTEPADINEPPNMPYPCFCITVPPGVVPFFLEGEQHWADEVWMHRYEAIDTLTGELAPFYRWSVGYKAVTLWRLRREYELDRKDRDTFHFWIPGEDEPPVPEDDITEQISLRLILNVCSWLSSVGGLQDKHKSFRSKNKLKKKRAGKFKKPGPITWILGREVKLDRVIREAATDFALGRSNKPRAGWKQRVQTVVRGHFQHYWVGKGEDKKRVPKWKDPYAKNKDANVAYAHLYKDKSDGD